MKDKLKELREQLREFTIKAETNFISPHELDGIIHELEGLIYKNGYDDELLKFEEAVYDFRVELYER